MEEEEFVVEDHYSECFEDDNAEPVEPTAPADDTHAADPASPHQDHQEQERDYEDKQDNENNNSKEGNAYQGQSKAQSVQKEKPAPKESFKFRRLVQTDVNIDFQQLSPKELVRVNAKMRQLLKELNSEATRLLHEKRELMERGKLKVAAQTVKQSTEVLSHSERNLDKVLSSQQIQIARLETQLKKYEHLRQNDQQPSERLQQIKAVQANIKRLKLESKELGRKIAAEEQREKPPTLGSGLAASKCHDNSQLSRLQSKMQSLMEKDQQLQKELEQKALTLRRPSKANQQLVGELERAKKGLQSVRYKQNTISQKLSVAVEKGKAEIRRLEESVEQKEKANRAECFKLAQLIKALMSKSDRAANGYLAESLKQINQKLSANAEALPRLSLPQIRSRAASQGLLRRDPNKLEARAWSREIGSTLKSSQAPLSVPPGGKKQSEATLELSHLKQQGPQFSLQLKHQQKKNSNTPSVPSAPPSEPSATVVPQMPQPTAEQSKIPARRFFMRKKEESKAEQQEVVPPTNPEQPTRAEEKGEERMRLRRRKRAEEDEGNEFMS